MVDHCIRLTLPGKVLLFGEYAVLHGAPAIVAAVDRRARVQLEAGPGAEVSVVAPGIADAPVTVWPRPDTSPTLAAVAEAVRTVAAELAREQTSLSGARLTLDTTAFHAGRPPVKLGLGSSSASVAGAVAALLARAGTNLHRRPGLHRALALAHGAHFRAQGGTGSGADVAACLYGGILEVRASGGPAPPVVREIGARGVPLWRFVWVGAPSSTRDLVNQVAAVARAEPVACGRIFEQMGRIATAAARAMRNLQPIDLIALAADYHRQMDALGELTGAAIVTPPLRALAEVAEAHRGAAKPSGAGGGDLAMVLAPSPDALKAITAEVRAAGMLPVDLNVDERGLSMEDAA
jgi:phosphomevalonate kinase